jgi:hypothetical protein
MSRHQPCFEKWQQRFAVMFAVVGGLGLLIPLRTQGQVDWVVTINFKNGDTPAYTVDRTPTTGGSCMYEAPADGNAYRLEICPHDTISWRALTPKGMHDVTIFHEDAIFKDTQGNPLGHWMRTSDASPTPVATPSVPPNINIEHVYSVAVYDRSGKVLYAHDPKLIIGTGTAVGVTREQVKEQLGVVDKNARELVKQLQEAAKTPQFFKSNDAAKDAEEDAEKIRKLVEEIQKKLATQ